MDNNIIVEILRFMTVRIVKVIRAVYPPDGPWHVYDEKHEWDEEIYPDNDLREWVGSRPYVYLKAERGPDGWRIKSRWKGRLYW